MELRLKNFLKDIEEIENRLAHIHQQPLSSDLYDKTLLNGQYLYKKSCAYNMPYCSGIQKTLHTTDSIIKQKTSAVTSPHVYLWHQQDECIKTYGSFYGNPAWDIGLVLNLLGENNKAEVFLRQYFENNGMRVTIIELYIGILYAKLNDAIEKYDRAQWRRIAKNECKGILCGKEVGFKELPAETLTRLKLPGLSRLE